MALQARYGAQRGPAYIILPAHRSRSDTSFFLFVGGPCSPCPGLTIAPIPGPHSRAAETRGRVPLARQGPPGCLWQCCTDAACFLAMRLVVEGRGTRRAGLPQTLRARQTPFTVACPARYPTRPGVLQASGLPCPPNRGLLRATVKVREESTCPPVVEPPLRSTTKGTRHGSFPQHSRRRPFLSWLTVAARSLATLAR